MKLPIGLQKDHTISEGDQQKCYNFSEPKVSILEALDKDASQACLGYLAVRCQALNSCLGSLRHVQLEKYRERNVLWKSSLSPLARQET